MKIRTNPTKPYSWLEWPVTLKGLPAAHNPHITAKFFGSAIIDPAAVERLSETIRPYIPWKPDMFMWETEIWHGHDNKSYFVLHITRYPEEMGRLHRTFDLIKDQNTPWKPHITVPKAFFFLVEDGALDPRDLELEIGELTLCLGGENRC